MEDKPKVLVLGGVGFVGRNFVKYLVDNDLASYVRVVDKVLPPTAFLGKPHQAAFDDSRVEFMQGNLTNPSTFGLALVTMFACCWRRIIALGAFGAEPN